MSSNWPYPFAPPQQIQYAQPLQPLQPPINHAEYRRTETVPDEMEDVLFCDYCQEEISMTNPGINVFVGIAGRRPDGRPGMVIDPDITNPYADIHIECMVEFAKDIQTEFMGPPDEEPIYCAGCEAKLDGRVD